MADMLSLRGVEKIFATGAQALGGLDLDVREGEFLSLLGPSGCGKSTALRMIAGLSQPTRGSMEWRAGRPEIGFVFQDAVLMPWANVFDNVWLPMRLTGQSRAQSAARIEAALELVGLHGFAKAYPRELSGGMKRRLLIAKALSHEPQILFLDEPTAGVDVQLRRDMWQLVRSLRDTGVTIILTTHYIDEAEEMADRIGVIAKGEIILVENKAELMRKLGKKQLTLQLQNTLDRISHVLTAYHLELANNGTELIYTYDAQADRAGIAALLKDLTETGIRFKDLHTTQSSLEDIFVTLVSDRK